MPGLIIDLKPKNEERIRMRTVRAGLIVLTALVLPGWVTAEEPGPARSITPAISSRS